MLNVGVPVYVHEESALSQVDSPAALNTMHSIINVLADIAIDIALKPELAIKAREELAERT